MENLPKKIYLQIGGSDVTIGKNTTDWNDLFHGAITWAEHRINDNDIEFVLSNVVEQSDGCYECGSNNLRPKEYNCLDCGHDGYCY